MPEKLAVGCARPTGGPVGAADSPEAQAAPVTLKEERKMVQVGKKAPDFVAPAYHNGEFTSLKLSDYLGRWVVLCFYPGDFTFV